jgi:DMSO reductase family type II enzyme chaperone
MEEEVDLALCRAALYSALALAFRRPSVETIERLIHADAVEALVEAARFLDEASLAPVVQRLSDGETDLTALDAQYRHLFGHTARCKVPPYETEYGDDDLFQQPQELSDLAGFMNAFGLTVRPDAHERVDHVSCECEFLAFLAWKEAYARSTENAEMCDATKRAAALFLRDHLGRFAPAFSQRLMHEDARSFYARAASFLEALVRSDCQRLGVEPGPQNLRLRLPAFGRVPVGCGETCGVPGGAEAAPTSE